MNTIALLKYGVVLAAATFFMFSTRPLPALATDPSVEPAVQANVADFEDASGGIGLIAPIGDILVGPIGCDVYAVMAPGPGCYYLLGGAVESRIPLNAVD